MPGSRGSRADPRGWARTAASVWLSSLSVVNASAAGPRMAGMRAGSPGPHPTFLTTHRLTWRTRLLRQSMDGLVQRKGFLLFRAQAADRDRTALALPLCGGDD